MADNQGAPPPTGGTTRSFSSMLNQRGVGRSILKEKKPKSAWELMAKKEKK